MYLVRLELTTGNIEFIIDDLQELEDRIQECGETYIGCQIKRINDSEIKKTR